MAGYDKGQIATLIADEEKEPGRIADLCARLARHLASPELVHKQSLYKARLAQIKKLDQKGTAAEFAARRAKQAKAAKKAPAGQPQAVVATGFSVKAGR